MADNPVKVHGVLASPYASRVIFALEYKGIDYELARPDGGFKTPEYLAINPMGKIPAFQNDDINLGESEVINEYIEERYPDKPLLPANLEDRARIRMLDRIVDLYGMSNAMGLVRMDATKSTDQDMIQGFIDGANASLNYFEHYLGDGPWAVGDQISLADCALIANFHCLDVGYAGQGIENPYADYPKISAWWAHLKQDAMTSDWIGRYEESLKQFVAFFFKPKE